MSNFKEGARVRRINNSHKDHHVGWEGNVAGVKINGNLRFGEDTYGYNPNNYELIVPGPAPSQDGDTILAEVQDSNKQPGAKADAGKVRAGLVLEGFSRPLLEVARVGTFGANKYSDNGWKSVPNAKARYTDAMYRHLMNEALGEANDPESELAHAAHAAWNALARLHFILEERDAANQS